MMKKHFISLLEPAHRRLTISFFAIALILIVSSMLVGIADNLPGIAMLLVGMILLFFSILHPWRKVENYAILIGICFGIIAVIFLGIYILSLLHKTQYISEGVVMTIIFLLCVPGILTGIFGAIFWSLRKK
jgi:hypothetical protein